MKQLFCLIYVLIYVCFGYAQSVSDTLSTAQSIPKADDPSDFFTRIEVFNELQYRNTEDFFLNKTTLRTNLKIGKRFTTRFDLPFIYNTFSLAENNPNSGIGDISFRILGYKFIENPKSALTASIEISLNTAQSPTLGTGKNILIPMVSYTRRFPKEMLFVAMLFQQVNSVSGDETRKDISYSKIELIGVKTWSRSLWLVIAPEWYFDYVSGGVSMNIRSRLVYAPKSTINIWITPGVGIFGDFIARYQWSADIGFRYYLFKDKSAKK